MPKLRFTDTAKNDLQLLRNDLHKAKILKAVNKTLAYMETNLRHPSLNTHEYENFEGPHREKIFEAYAQQKTPGAYRVFWYYGPEKNMISITAIIPHP